jgi:hypothetical protein
VHAIGFKEARENQKGLSNVVRIVALEKRIKAKAGLFVSTTRVSLNEPEKQGRAVHIEHKTTRPPEGS